MQSFVTYALGAVSFGSLLFLVTSGFCLIFGLMKIPNLAHGAMFMLGAYVGVAMLRSGMPFLIAVLAAGVVVSLLGWTIERLLLRRIFADENAQVLATIGVAFVLNDVVLMIWGGNPLRAALPVELRSQISIFDSVFPVYRLFVAVCAVAVAGLLWLLIERTRIGAMLRAGVDDLEMSRGLGIPVSLLFGGTFAAGSFLAGVAGALASPILSAYPGMDFDVLPLALVVVILGGMGSLAGAFIGSYIVGVLYVAGPVLFPELAYFILFAPMLIVMIVRPAGLFGRAQ